MSEELQALEPMRIVPAMKKPACFLLFLLVAAPAFAQSQQFGILFGGTKRLYSGHDKEAGIPENNVAGFSFTPPDRIRLNSGAREVFWAIQVEPQTYFKIQAGQPIQMFRKAEACQLIGEKSQGDEIGGVRRQSEARQFVQPEVELSQSDEGSRQGEIREQIALKGDRFQVR